MIIKIENNFHLPIKTLEKIAKDTTVIYGRIGLEYDTSILTISHAITKLFVEDGELYGELYVFNKFTGKNFFNTSDGITLKTLSDMGKFVCVVNMLPPTDSNTLDNFKLLGINYIPLDN